MKNEKEKILTHYVESCSFCPYLIFDEWGGTYHSERCRDILEEKELEKYLLEVYDEGHFGNVYKKYPFISDIIKKMKKEVISNGNIKIDKNSIIVANLNQNNFLEFVISNNSNYVNVSCIER